MGTRHNKEHRMTKPKLSTKTPDEDDLNSWIGNHDDLMERPRERRYAIVEYKVAERRLPTDGDTYPILQIVHIEDIVDDVEKAVTLLGKAYTKRTGNKSIPAPDTPLDFEAIDVDDSVTV
jgi:hypothetical protein